jgi:signal transduction histidine kinase
VYAFLKCWLCAIWGQRLQSRTSVCFFKVQAVRDLGSAVTIKDECIFFQMQAVRDLGSAVAVKDEFLAVVGHELRTPLNAIIQLSKAMARGAGACVCVCVCVCACVICVWRGKARV